MIRFDAFFLVVVVASALGVVTAQHHSRKLFVALEHEQQRAKELEVEWGQLLLEQSTWSSLARVERIARQRLGLREPKREEVIVIGGVR